MIEHKFVPRRKGSKFCLKCPWLEKQHRKPREYKYRPGHGGKRKAPRPRKERRKCIQPTCIVCQGSVTKRGRKTCSKNCLSKFRDAMAKARIRLMHKYSADKWSDVADKWNWKYGEPTDDSS
jgi:hypothetical protein